MRILATVCLLFAVLVLAASLVAFVTISEVAFLGVIVALVLFTLGVGAQIVSRRP
jgi:hypothetical protein